MAEARVTHYIAHGIEGVFAAISDHQTFLGPEAGMQTRLVAEGKGERNGLGCVREIWIGKRIRYLEEITAWTQPTSFEYIIRESSVPIRHFGSRMEFKSEGTGTRIVWTSRYDITVPVIGWVLGWYIKNRYQRAFVRLLKEAGDRIERPAAKISGP